MPEYSVVVTVEISLRARNAEVAEERACKRIESVAGATVGSVENVDGPAGDAD